MVKQFTTHLPTSTNKWSNNWKNCGHFILVAMWYNGQLVRGFIHAGQTVWWTIRKWIKQPWIIWFTFYLIPICHQLSLASPSFFFNSPPFFHFTKDYRRYKDKQGIFLLPQNGLRTNSCSSQKVMQVQLYFRQEYSCTGMTIQTGSAARSMACWRQQKTICQSLSL